MKTSNQFLEKYGILVVYGIALLSLMAGVYYRKCEQHWIMLIPIITFVLYDSWFRFLRKGKWEHSGRNYKETIVSIRAASQYTSYIIAFVGVSLSLLHGGPDEISKMNIFENNWTKVYGFLVLSLSGLVLLFIPIPYLNKNKKKDKEPTTALKNCFFVVLLAEKVIIILLIYLLLLIAL